MRKLQKTLIIKNFQTIKPSPESMGGRKLSPIRGKLLYDSPASVPETQAPADIVKNNKQR